MRNMFTEHPRNIGESYWAHFKSACQFAFYMVVGGVCCFIHAVFPFLFETTGSALLLKMIKNFVARMPATEPKIVELTNILMKKTTDHLVEESMTADLCLTESETEDV